MQLQLVYNFKQGITDVSDILRGKIQMLDDFLNMRKMFDRITEIERLVKEEEDKQGNSKGAK